nr:hypothetical protein CFP56_54469 [Quercus suber]
MRGTRRFGLSRSSTLLPVLSDCSSGDDVMQPHVGKLNPKVLYLYRLSSRARPGSDCTVSLRNDAHVHAAPTSVQRS